MFNAEVCPEDDRVLISLAHCAQWAVHVDALVASIALLILAQDWAIGVLRTLDSDRRMGLEKDREKDIGRSVLKCKG